MNLPAEAAEMETPIRLNRVALRPGSGGDGAHRGGLGTIREYEALVDDVSFTHRGGGSPIANAAPHRPRTGPARRCSGVRRDG